MSGVEITFWKDLIEKYLHPIDADKQREKKIAEGLTELRNKSVFFFSVFNALFVLIVFMLTLHKDTLHIDWPFGVKENITITEDEQVIYFWLIFQSLDLFSVDFSKFRTKSLMRKFRMSRRHLLAEKRAIHDTWYT